jgi:glycosyltransferase involved in cell wall biosynthesis
MTPAQLSHQMPFSMGQLSTVNPQNPAALRVAVVSDYLEERWPSMDLIGDMLTNFLQDQSAAGIEAAQLRPSMRLRLSRIPVFGRRRAASNADRLLNRFVDYPRWLGRLLPSFDLFHLVDHSYSQLLHALPKGRAVVTCHDLDTFRCLLEPERDPRGRSFRVMTRHILDGFLQAAHVIAVSHTTREELLRHQLFPAEAITVVPNGVHPSCSLEPDPESDAVAAGYMPEQVNPAENRPAVWLLNVGNTMQRKRLDVLLQVFAAVSREIPEARLLRVGGFTPAQLGLTRELNIEGLVSHLPHLDRPTLAAVYRRATLLVHTAEAEGFGLPLVEAMACGCPVAASDIPVLREVGGAVASFSPVADISVWRQTLIELLQEKRQQPDQWERRRQRSIAWSARYSWAENARQTASIYRRVMEK